MTHRVVDNPMGQEVEQELDCHSVPALDVPLLITGNMSFHEDEMMSWLMYPSDDTFDQPYGSDLFGDFTNPHLHLVKDAFIHQTLKESELKTSSHDSARVHIDIYESEKTCNGSKNVYPDSCGLTKPNDELKKVSLGGHESKKTNYDMKRSNFKVHGPDRRTSDASKRFDLNGREPEITSDDPKRRDNYDGGLSARLVSSVESLLRNKSGLGPNPRQSEDRRISSQHPYEQQNDEIQYTFPLFSRPVAATRDSLRILGAESGPTNIERIRKPLSTELISSHDGSFPIHCSHTDAKNQFSEVKKTGPQCGLTCLKSSLTNNLKVMEPSESVRKPLSTDLISSHDVSFPIDGLHSAANNQFSEVKKTEAQSDITCLKSSVSNNSRVKESSMEHCSEGLKLNRSADNEHDLNIKSDNITSISGCPTIVSEYGTGMVEITSSSSIVSGSIIPSPTRACGNEEFQDVKDVGTTTKKSSSHLKRIRAAETHNESEKRRRNRINIKLKALQDLIPNSTKTDKASVLDDAIQYLKALQTQVQLMNTRSNIVFPPVMMLPGLQYVPMQGTSTLPHMGMGIGVRDMISAHQPVVQFCPVLPGQPLQAYHGAQMLHPLNPMVQAPSGYLPTAMPTHSDMWRNMKSDVSMQ